MKEHLFAIIMSGGRGKRFWPMSQKLLPKQFMHFVGEGTLFQQLVRKLRSLIPQDRIFTVTNETYKDVIQEQVPDFLEENIIVEPIRRNTAPCIGLSTIHIQRIDPEATTIVLPSDQFIADAREFADVLTTGVAVAEQHDVLVTLGIPPDSPHAGYGYIHADREFKRVQERPVLRVDRFIEKPDEPTAKRLLEAGGSYWNAGIFIWRASIIMEQFRAYLPMVFEHLMALQPFLGTPQEKETLATFYSSMPSISIDYGIMQRTSPIVMIPVEMGWSDIGSWAALEKIYGTDKDKNLIRGDLVFTADVTRSLIVSDGQVIAVGIQDLIVIQREDSLLICAKGLEDRIPDLVDQLESSRESKE